MADGGSGDSRRGEATSPARALVAAVRRAAGLLAVVGQVAGIPGAQRGAPPRPGELTVGIDATPMIGQRSGVGRYVERVCAGVAAMPDAPDQVLTLFSRRKTFDEPMPPHTRPAHRSIPAKVLKPAWARFEHPSVERLTGPIDVFHGGNYLVPPVKRAATAVTVHDLTWLLHPQTLHPDSWSGFATFAETVLGYDAVITVSHAVAAEIEAELKVPADRIVVAPNGVDPSWLNAVALADGDRRRLGVPDRYFLFLGTIEPRKNLVTLLDAHRRARADRPDLPSLVLVGAAGWGDTLGRTGGDDQAVVTMGYLADAEVRALMAGAVAVCSPSVYEGFGLPVLEGLAVGAPVLASDIEPHREVSRGQATLIAARDLDGWAQALIAAADVDPTAEAVSGTAAARRAVARGYSGTASARMHLATYRSLAR